MTIEESGSCRMIDMDSSSDTANSDANTYGTAMDPKHIKCEQDDDNHDDQSRDFSPQKGRYHRYVSLKSKPHFSDSMIELDVMKTTIHDKGNQLSSVWNELYGLLGDYQAKLFSKEGDFLASKSKYDSVNDLDQLRNDLIGKDEEVKELMDRLQAIESRSETVQLDLSVKNSLLKKYQQDLLDKEAALLSLQSANKKLENRVQVLEAKLSADNRGTDNRVTDNHGSVLSRPLSERCSAMSLQRPSSSGLLRHTPPSLKRRGLPSSSIMHSIQKRRSQPPPAQAKAPMVCIEVEDEEDLNEINMSLTDAQVKTEPNVNAPLYIDAWSEGQQDNCEGRAETEATPLSSLPGDYTTHREGQYSQMSGQSADDSGQEQGDMKWQVPLQDGGMDTSLLGPGLDGSSQKDDPWQYPCPVCSRSFTQRSSLARHQRTIHLNIRKHVCHLCQKRFAEKCNYRQHMLRSHGIDVGQRRIKLESGMGAVAYAEQLLRGSLSSSPLGNFDSCTGPADTSNGDDTNNRANAGASFAVFPANEFG